ncbi:hypothetical protein KAR02_06295 [Candidatus Bipolaricaulota bacterium]|nr:hypothetical protein [Candidatus Bipolaricaulota bacterium]
MDKQTLRPVVFEILKKTPQTHFHAIENDLRKLVESYERRDVLTLQEILWELLVQGVLAPGKNSLNLNLPFVHVTDYGAQCLEDGRILAHDPDRYIEQLIHRVGSELDDLVIQSTREALAVFLSGSWSSSVILLARAAEFLFDQLADTLVSTRRHNDDIQALESSTRFTRSQAQAAIQLLQHRSLAAEISGSIEPQLNGLMALIQFSRNQDGTPRLPQPSRDQVLGFLLLFPEQCAFVYHLMSILEGDAAA